MEEIERADAGQQGAGAAEPALTEPEASGAAEPALTEPEASGAPTPAELETPKPAYLVPSNLAWVDGADFGMAEELYLTIVPDGRTVLLKDTARLIWHVAADGAVSVADEVAELVGLPVSEIDADVTHFLEDLTGRGLLVPHGS